MGLIAKLWVWISSFAENRTTCVSFYTYVKFDWFYEVIIVIMVDL
jgi:hypothetical protein